MNESVVSNIRSEKNDEKAVIRRKEEKKKKKLYVFKKSANSLFEFMVSTSLS